MVGKELLKGTLPLLVLHVVSAEETYGYELIKRLERLSGGTFSFAEGTLYPVLHALERDRLIASTWVGAAGARRRKYYRVTEAGRGELTRRLAEWRAFTQAVDAVVEGGGHGRT